MIHIITCREDQNTNADDVATTGVRRNFTLCFYFPRYSKIHLIVVNISILCHTRVLLAGIQDKTVILDSRQKHSGMTNHLRTSRS